MPPSVTKQTKTPVIRKFFELFLEALKTSPQPEQKFAPISFFTPHDGQYNFSPHLFYSQIPA